MGSLGKDCPKTESRAAGLLPNSCSFRLTLLDYIGDPMTSRLYDSSQRRFRSSPRKTCVTRGKEYARSLWIAGKEVSPAAYGIRRGAPQGSAGTNPFGFSPIRRAPCESSPVLSAWPYSPRP